MITKNKAYSILEVTKSYETEEERIITGIATTPSPDRVDDVIVSEGVTFKNPLPLLWQHDHSKPVGTVEFDKPTSKGVTFTARISKINEPGTLKDRTDEAWQSVKAGIVRGVSIGFRALKDGAETLKSGGIKFYRTEVFELSLVTIPCNHEATITSIKSFDNQHIASDESSDLLDEQEVKFNVGVTAKGNVLVRLNNNNDKGKIRKMNIAKQIEQYTANRDAKNAEMKSLLEKSIEEGRTLDVEEAERYDELEAEVKSLDTQLARMSSLEKSAATNATEVENTVKTVGAPAVVRNKKQLPKGTAFTRYALAMAASKGNVSQAHEMAKTYCKDTPEVAELLRLKAVGTTSGEAFAAPLVEQSNMVGEFMDLLRPATVLGQMNGFRNVPFNVRVPLQTGGASVSWVGEGQRKPNSELAFDTISLGFSKIAGIVPITEELARFSNPSAEAVIQRDLIAGIAGFMDQQMFDENKAEADSSPAGLTNGATVVASTGLTAEAYAADIEALMTTFVEGNLSLAGSYLVMSEQRAMRIGNLRDSQGNAYFQGMGFQSALTGQRSLMGLPVVVSEAIADKIVLVKPSEILLADDGGVDIDISREASITIGGQQVSAWENNLVLVRAERFVRWKKARASAVAYISYAAPTA